MKQLTIGKHLPTLFQNWVKKISDENCCVYPYIHEHVESRNLTPSTMERAGCSRPLSKLANVRQVIGDSARVPFVYPYIHEDLSTEATHQSSTVIEFQKRYNAL